MLLYLRDGISWCMVSERLLFLDVAGDRYFCLDAQAEAAFKRLADGAILEPWESAMLLDTGVVAPSGHGTLAPCPPAPCPTGSLCDLSTAQAHGIDVLHAAMRLFAARVALRTLGLGGSLHQVAKHKARSPARATRAAVERVATSSLRLADWIGSHDQCLPRSIATARHLTSIGAAPTLVIAVKLEPFKAHCWVQWGGLLVNERVEAVQAFTPIRIL